MTFLQQSWYDAAERMSGQDPSRASTAAAGTPRFPELKALFAELFEASGAGRCGLAQEEFARILEEVAVRALGAHANAGEARELCRGLHLEELALARACAAGHEAAWELFLTRYREKLFEVARGMVRDEAKGRELADSIYADLYGMGVRDGERVSKLASYNGRGSLEGWLRTVLAQEYVNRYRKGRRLVSLEEEEEAGRQFVAADAPAVATADARLEAATDEALGALSAEDRFLMAAYFLDGRTLAEIARMLSVHESTISRRVVKVAAGVRKAIEDGLLRRGMSARQAAEALETDVRDLGVSVRNRLEGGAKR